MAAPKFPKPVLLKGLLLFDRWELEDFKLRLLGRPSIPRDPEKPIQFVLASNVSTEFNFSRATLDRHIAASEAAA